MVGEISTLGHEVVDDSVEVGVFEAISLWVFTELSEIFGSFGDNIVEKFKDDFTSFVGSEIEVEEDFRLAHKICL